MGRVFEFMAEAWSFVEVAPRIITLRNRSFADKSLNSTFEPKKHPQPFDYHIHL